MKIAVLSNGAHRRPVVPPRAWLAPAVASAAVLVLLAGGERARMLLRWERAGLAAGQWWRLLSGHFVHLGVEHALLNLAGLWLLWALLARGWSACRWLLVAGCAIGAIDAGLWLFNPTTDWYVGSSGVLHGVMAAGLAAWLRTGRRGAGWLAAALAAKLAWEHWQGALPLTSGGVVVTAAHLYGAAGGLLAGLAGPAAQWMRARRRKPL